MPTVQKITPCLWFDHQAEEAVGFYTAIFENSRILNIARYGEAGQEDHGKPPGSVMTVAFELGGQSFCQMLWMWGERILHDQAAFFSSPSTNTTPAMTWSRSR